MDIFVDRAHQLVEYDHEKIPFLIVPAENGIKIYWDRPFTKDRIPPAADIQKADIALMKIAGNYTKVPPVHSIDVLLKAAWQIEPDTGMQFPENSQVRIGIFFKKDDSGQITESFTRMFETI